MAYPLTGLRVLDLSRVLAGPYVGRMLADLGADVVKLEPPEGDVTRYWGKKVAGLSGYYTQQNVGKRNVCVDLRRPAGPELVRALAAHADVLVENFRPGVMAQYGLGYDDLSVIAPRLVMLSISGFGQSGPESRRAAYASVVHAESGVVDRLRPLAGGSLAEPRLSFADMNAGLHGLVGVFSALWMRERTGRGQHVDIAMLDTMLATDDYVNLALDGVPTPHGISSDVWDTSAGPMVLAGDPRWIWKRLSAVHGLADGLEQDAPLAEKAAVRKREMTRFLKSFESADALFAALEQAGLAFGCVKDSASAIQSPTVRHRKSVVEVDDRQGGRRPVIQSPYRFSHASSGAQPSGASYRGEHNRAVLMDWLGYGDEPIDALLGQGALLSDLPQETGD